jgi:hypothetical protein
MFTIHYPFVLSYYTVQLILLMLFCLLNVQTTSCRPFYLISLYIVIIRAFLFINALLALASTGLVLDRYRLWQLVEPRATPSPTNVNVSSTPNRWSEAWVELAMAWYIGFACFWIFSLLIACLSFKYYRAVLIVPNIAALTIGLLINALGFAVILGRILNVSKPFRTSEYEDVILVYVMGLLLFTFLSSIVFLIISGFYHDFLSGPNSATSKPLIHVQPTPVIIPSAEEIY